MPVNPDFRDLFSKLNAAEPRYLIVGAHAVTLLDVEWLEKSRKG